MFKLRCRQRKNASVRNGQSPMKMHLVGVKDRAARSASHEKAVNVNIPAHYTQITREYGTSDILY